jgi:hypothetical protein
MVLHQLVLLVHGAHMFAANLLVSNTCSAASPCTTAAAAVAAACLRMNHHGPLPTANQAADGHALASYLYVRGSAGLPPCVGGGCTVSGSMTGGVAATIRVDISSGALTCALLSASGGSTEAPSTAACRRHARLWIAGGLVSCQCHGSLQACTHMQRLLRLVLAWLCASRQLAVP